MIEIKRIQQQPGLAQAIYAVMTDVYPVNPWNLEQIQADLSQDQTWYALAFDGVEVIGFLAVQENLFEKRMEAVNRAKENTRKKFHTAEEIVELLTDKELTISDVKNVLEIVYDMAMNKARLK